MGFGPDGCYEFLYNIFYHVFPLIGKLDILL
jgi:hypothetical protein